MKKVLFLLVGLNFSISASEVYVLICNTNGQVEEKEAVEIDEEFIKSSFLLSQLHQRRQPLDISLEPSISGSMIKELVSKSLTFNERTTSSMNNFAAVLNAGYDYLQISQDEPPITLEKKIIESLKKLPKKDLINLFDKLNFLTQNAVSFYLLKDRCIFKELVRPNFVQVSILNPLYTTAMSLLDMEKKDTYYNYVSTDGEILANGCSKFNQSTSERFCYANKETIISPDGNNTVCFSRKIESDCELLNSKLRTEEGIGRCVVQDIKFNKEGSYLVIRCLLNRTKSHCVVTVNTKHIGQMCKPANFLALDNVGEFHRLRSISGSKFSLVDATNNNIQIRNLSDAKVSQSIDMPFKFPSCVGLLFNKGQNLIGLKSQSIIPYILDFNGNVLEIERVEDMQSSNIFNIGNDRFIMGIRIDPCTQSESIKVWDGVNGQLVHSSTGPKGYNSCVSLIGNWIYLANNTTLNAYNLLTKEEKKVAVFENKIDRVFTSANEEIIAVKLKNGIQTLKLEKEGYLFNVPNVKDISWADIYKIELERKRD